MKDQGRPSLSPLMQAVDPKNPLAEGKTYTREEITQMAREAGEDFAKPTANPIRTQQKGGALANVLMHLNDLILWNSKKTIEKVSEKDFVFQLQLKNIKAMSDWIMKPFVAEYRAAGGKTEFLRSQMERMASQHFLYRGIPHAAEKLRDLYNQKSSSIIDEIFMHSDPSLN